MKRNTKVGLCFLLGPFIGLIFILSGWAFMSVVAGLLVSSANVAMSDSNNFMVFIRFTNIALGLLGLLCVIGIPIGLVGGIYYLAKGDGLTGTNQDQTKIA